MQTQKKNSLFHSTARSAFLTVPETEVAHLELRLQISNLFVEFDINLLDFFARKKDMNTDNCSVTLNGNRCSYPPAWALLDGPP